jgi:MFS family permease
MIARLFPVGALLTGTAIFMLGHGLLGTLLVVRIHNAGHGAVVAGLVASAYFLGLILGCIHAGRAVSAVGHIRAFAVFAGVSAAIASGYPLADDPVAWTFLRFTQGFMMAGLFMIIESWLNAATEDNWRGRVFSAYMVINYISLGLGQLLLNLYPVQGFELFTVATILFAVSLVPVSLSRQTAPEAPEMQIMGLPTLFRVSPLGAVGAITAGALLGAFYGLVPVFARRIGLSISDVGTLMAVVIVGGLIVQYPAGYLGDWIDRRKVLTGAAWIVAVSAAAVSLASFSQADWAPGVAAIGLCSAFALYPLAVGHANDRASPESRVGLAAGLLLAYSVGAVSGPVIAALAMRVGGPYGLFAFMAVVAAGAGSFALYRMRAVPPVPLAEQTELETPAMPAPVTPVPDPLLEVPTEESGPA